jgi:hypothetical protein
LPSPPTTPLPHHQQQQHLHSFILSFIHSLILSIPSDGEGEEAEEEDFPFVVAISAAAIAC